MNVRMLALATLFAHASGGWAAPVYPEPARDDAILLSTIEVGGGGGHAPETEQRIEFLLDLRPVGSNPPGARLADGTFYSEGGSGTFNFAADSDNFSQFAQIATNGINDQYLIYTLWPNGMGGGSGGFESQLFANKAVPGLALDLFGYRLDYVQLTVSDVRFSPWPPGNPAGYAADYTLTYEFFGSPIPEPRTLYLALPAVLLFATIGRRTIINNSANGLERSLSHERAKRYRRHVLGQCCRRESRYPAIRNRAWDIR